MSLTVPRLPRRLLRPLRRNPRRPRSQSQLMRQVQVQAQALQPLLSMTTKQPKTMVGYPMHLIKGSNGH